MKYLATKFQRLLLNLINTGALLS